MHACIRVCLPPVKALDFSNRTYLRRAGIEDRGNDAGIDEYVGMLTLLKHFQKKSSQCGIVHL